MTVKEIFLQKLKDYRYENPEFWAEGNFDLQLLIAEKDAENIFKIMYGDKLIQGHGKGEVKEYIYRYLEAKGDVQNKMILLTMHYLVMQIHLKQITL